MTFKAAGGGFIEGEIGRVPKIIRVNESLLNIGKIKFHVKCVFDRQKRDRKREGQTGQVKQAKSSRQGFLKLIATVVRVVPREVFFHERILSKRQLAVDVPGIKTTFAANLSNPN